MLGQGLLWVGCGFAVYAAISGSLAARSRRPKPAGAAVAVHEPLVIATSAAPIAESARRALFACAGCFTLAAILLWYALFTRDFSLTYVAAVSSRATPVWYTFSSFWSAMDGSLLLWIWFLSLYAALFAKRNRSPWAITVLGITIAFFATVTAAASSPFQRLDVIPLDGRGLNPLLQSPGMIIHPPMLYAGLTGLSIPFAIAIAALITRDRGWIVQVRKWVLVSWLLLGAGMVIGGSWAYTELGWGGYWGWDPVENAALLPWLAATAFLHSAIVEQTKGMLRIWNIFLVIMAADLAIFGTFLTRSGLLSSVHTFAESPVGRWFFIFLAAQTLAGAALLVWRLPAFRTQNQLGSLVAKESAFLVNNLLFVGAAVVIAWGTLLPIISEAATGRRLGVGPVYFNRIIAPLGALLLVLAAIGPALQWGRGSIKAAILKLAPSITTGVVATIAAAVLSRNASFAVLIGICVFLATTSAIAIARPRGSLIHTFTRNPRRYGGYLVHLGMAILVIGFAGSLFRTQTEVSAKPGDRFDFAGQSFEYRELQRGVTADKQITLAVLDLYRDGRKLSTLKPQLNVHENFDQPQSEIAIRTTPMQDTYVILAGVQANSDEVTFRIHHNPLVFWVWLGTAVCVAGALVALLVRGPRTPSCYLEQGNCYLEPGN